MRVATVCDAADSVFAAHWVASRVRAFCTKPMPPVGFWERWFNGLTLVEAFLYIWIITFEVCVPMLLMISCAMTISCMTHLQHPGFVSAVMRSCIDMDVSWFLRFFGVVSAPCRW